MKGSSAVPRAGTRARQLKRSLRFHMKILALCVALLLSTNALAQEVPQDSFVHDVVEASPPAGPPAYILAVIVITPKFEWREATRDSVKFFMIQTAARLSMQSKTREDLSGKFVKEYFQTLATKPSGWR